MQTTQQRFRGLWLLIVLMALIIGVRHFDLLKAPNQHFIGNSMDGYRSYMAAMYHVQHDKTYRHYEGMNFPYGDRVDYTDNLPILTNSIKFISQNIVDLFPYLTGIWNVFLLLSILLSGIFVYLIFRELELPLWYALLVTLGITFLAPQLTRFHAHYGLAHPFVIPMMIYLLLRFERKPSWKFSLGIGTVILLTYGLHSYLFALSILLVGFYWVMKLLREITWANFKKVLLHGGIQTLFPFFILAITVLLNDPVSDRPMKPYGFFSYRAYLLGIFFPLDFQAGRLLKEWLGPLKYIKGEGTIYIGFMAVLFSITIVIWRLWHFRQRKWLAQALDQHRHILVNLLGAAVVLLLLSLGLPFTIPGAEDLLNYTGPFQQFRSVGRFAWVFYYVINILAFYMAYHWIMKIERKNWRIAALIFVIGFLNFESITFFFKHRYRLYPHPTIRKKYKSADNPWIKTTDWSKYQAILPIPYFHIGSENIWFRAEGPVLQRSMWTSIQTGLPMLSSFMGRTSISQTLDFVTLVKEPYRPSKILDLVDPEKSILIFVQKGNYNPKKAQYNYLFSDLKPFFEDKEILLYELTISRLRQRIDQRKNAAFTALDTLTLFPQEDLWTTDSLNSIVYQSFDYNKTERTYSGEGAFSGKAKVEHIIYEGHLPEQKANSSYIYACWLYIGEDLAARSWLNLEEFNRSSGKRIRKKGYKVDQFIRAVDAGWALIEVPFKLKKNDSGLRTTIINHDLFKRPLFVDEQLIRPASTQVFKQSPKAIWQNNRKFEKE